MKIILYLLSLGLSFASCDDDRRADDAPRPKVLSIDLSKRYQPIEGFGASDAWSAQYVGGWSDPVKNAIADLLFSKDLDADGSPKGIGLNIWRFNIGTGSAAQGTNSGIVDKWRRTEGFLRDDGSYDWNQQRGQRWFLQAAKKRGVEKFIGFANSAPVQLTKNGRANTSVAQQSNLAPENFGRFADYLTQVVYHLQQTDSITLSDISPVNEPQWDWDAKSGQEGCPFTNEEMAQLARILDAKLTEQGLATKIELTEAGQLPHLYRSGTNRPQKDNQISTFYGHGEHSVATLSHLSDFVAGHSYGTTELSKLVPQRQQLWQKMQSVNPNLKYNMSEYCIMGDKEAGIKGSGKDLSIQMGLYLARVLHYDLTVANASAWQWWLAISPYNYKDGLIYIDKSETDGGFQTSKMLYALGNYSRFLRKGMYRVHTNQLFGKTNEDTFTQKRVMASAYADDKELVLVLVNYSDHAYTIQLDTQGGLDGHKMEIYRTSASENLTHVGSQLVGQDISVAPESITTYVVQRKP